MTVVLTVVGRSDSRKGFTDVLRGSAFRLSFKIHPIVPLDEDGEAKRFLTYLTFDDEHEEEANSVANYLGGMMYSVEFFDSMDEASEYASEEYTKVAYSAFSDTPLTSEEFFQRDVLIALAGNPSLVLMRGILNGKPTSVIAHYSIGESNDDDAVATPLAILIDDETGRQLELPVKSSYERGN